MIPATRDAAFAAASSDGRTHPCEPVLDMLRDESAVHFGAEGVRLAPVAFDERIFSWVLRAAVHYPGERLPRSHVFVKVFKPRKLANGQPLHERVAQDFDTTRRIHEAMSQWPDLGAVRPVACYPDWLAIVTEEIPGLTLGALLEAHARWFPASDTLRELEDAFIAVGRWVRAFQAIDEQSGHVTLDEIRRYIDVRLERLVGAPLAAFTKADRVRVLGHIDGLARLVPAPDLAEVLVHADLAPGNVVVSDRRVVVLDFAMTHRGSRIQDITRLYVQLDLMLLKPYFRRRVIHLLQQALVRGFDPALLEDGALFRLMLLRHHVNHLTTLSVREERFPARLYSARLRRAHRRWIEHELASGPTGGHR